MYDNVLLETKETKKIMIQLLTHLKHIYPVKTKYKTNTRNFEEICYGNLLYKESTETARSIS